MTKEQIEIMIESLEELNEELSIQNKGSLCFEQWELLDYFKKLDLKDYGNKLIRPLLVDFIMSVADCYDMDNREKAENCVDEYLNPN
jgi:hypothetical protein